jgi:hypothetical protein
MEHIVYMGEEINVHKIFIGETEEITRFRRPRHNISCYCINNVGGRWRKNV